MSRTNYLPASERPGCRHQEGVKMEAHDTLGAIADLRVNQVAEWREAYKKSAEVMVGDPLLAMEIERWLQRGSLLDADAQRIVRRLKSMRQAYGFMGVFIMEENGVGRDVPVTCSSAKAMKWWL